MILKLKPNDRYILCRNTKTNEEGIYDLKEKVFIKVEKNIEEKLKDIEYIVSSEEFNIGEKL